MTSHADLGIPDDIYEAALRVMGHSWRAGLRCAIMNCGHVEGRHPSVGFGARLEHDSPIPPVTDELVMAMLDALPYPILSKSPANDQWCVAIVLKPHQSRHTQFIAPTKAAAVIRATAGLEVK